MKVKKVKIVNKSNNPLPEYKTPGSAGVDLRANVTETTYVYPMKRALVPTGLYIALPRGYEAQVRPRSGLAINNGIFVLNTPGTIDSDYRGELKVILANLSDTTFKIEPGDRIAQLVISKYETAEFELVDELDETERGEGGFGHTGNK